MLSCKTGSCGEPRHQPASSEAPFQRDRGKERHVDLHDHCQLSGNLQRGSQVSLPVYKYKKKCQVENLKRGWTAGDVWANQLKIIHTHLTGQ